MPFCPNCRIEYVGDATRCVDCGAGLVASLAQATPGLPDPGAMRPTELCQVDDHVQLDLIEAQLRAAGIPSTRRARSAALFVPASRLEEAQRVLAGESPTPGPPSGTVGLSDLHRLRLVCARCEKVTSVDLLEERPPATCACGHVFDWGEAGPIIDRYMDIVRRMADAEFEIELELPGAEE